MDSILEFIVGTNLFFPNGVEDLTCFYIFLVSTKFFAISAPLLTRMLATTQAGLRQKMVRFCKNHPDYAPSKIKYLHFIS